MHLTVKLGSDGTCLGNVSFLDNVENSFDFFGRQGEDEGFHFSFEEFEQVDLSLVPNEAGSEIPTIVTYDYETPFDVNQKKKNWTIGSAVWRVLKWIPSKRKIGNRIFQISFFFIAVENTCFQVVNERAKEE